MSAPYTAPDVALPLAELRQPLLDRAHALWRRHRGSASEWSPEDLVQETLTRLCGAATEAKLAGLSAEQIRPYAMRVLAHLFIDEVVRRKRAEPRSAAVLEEALAARPPTSAAGASPEVIEHQLVHRQQVGSVRDALAVLTADERAFLLLSFERGSATAAQAELGWPPGGASNAAMKRVRLIRTVQRALCE